MKRILSFVSILFLSILSVFTLAACGGKEPVAADLLKTVLLEEDGLEVTKNFNVVSKLKRGDKEYPLTWVSDNDYVKVGTKEEEGKYEVEVTRPDEYQTATLTATLTVSKKNTATKNFTVRVAPYSVFEFSSEFVFPQKGKVVYESFDLATSYTLKDTDKTATISWASDNELIKISEDGSKALVTLSSDETVVHLNATFTYGGKSTTKSFDVKVYKPMTKADQIHYWYTNEMVSQTISGYIAEIADPYNSQYGNVSLYVLDDSFTAGYYLFRTKVEAKEAEQIEIGAHVTITGSTNTNYSGLMETNAKSGQLVVDENIEKINISDHIYAIDNDLIANAQSLYYRSSTLVTLTNWKIDEVLIDSETDFSAQGTTPMLKISKNGVQTKITYSKYIANTKQKGEVAEAVKAAVIALKAGDYINISGLLGYHNDKDAKDRFVQASYQIAVTGVNSITAGTANEDELPGKKVGAAITANANLFPVMVNGDKEIALPTENNGVTISWAFSDELVKCAKIENNKLVITAPKTLEKFMVVGTYTNGDYSTDVRYEMAAIAKTPQQKVDDELAAFKLDTAYQSGKEFDLVAKGAMFDDVAITYAIKSGDFAKIVDGKLVLDKIYEEGTAVITVTFTCGEITDSKDVEIKVLASEKIEDVYAPAVSLDVNTTYKLGMDHKGANKFVYFIGTIGSNHFGETSEKLSEGVDITLVEAKVGYNLKFTTADGKTQYINAVKKQSGDKTFYNFVVEDAASSAWLIDETGNICTMLEGTKFYIGTRNDKTFTTLGLVKDPAKSYVANLYCKTVAHEIANPVFTEGYKFVLNQEKINKTLYMTGEVNTSGFGLTTESENDATLFYFEAVEGGYNIYFMNGEAKTYVSVYYNADSKIRMTTTKETPSVWVWDAENKTFKTNEPKDGADKFYFLGAYNTFDTISASGYNHLDTSFVSHLWGYVEQPIPTPTESPEDLLNTEMAAFEIANLNPGSNELVLVGTTDANIKISYALAANDFAELDADGKTVIVKFFPEDHDVTFTVTFTVGELSKTKEVTVKALATPTSTVEDAKALANGAYTYVSGVVVSTDKDGYILRDATGFILVYTNGSDVKTIPALGKTVKFLATKASYNGAAQLKQATEPELIADIQLPALETVAYDKAKLDEAVAKEAVENVFISFEGTIEAFPYYVNVNVEGTTVTFSIKAAKDLLDEIKTLDGLKASFKGYVANAKKDKYLTVYISEFVCEPTDDEKATVALNKVVKQIPETIGANKEITLEPSLTATITAATEVAGVTVDGLKLTFVPTSTKVEGNITITATVGAVTKTATVKVVLLKDEPNVMFAPADSGVANKAEIVDPVTKGDFTFTFTGTKNYTNELRFYADNTLKISSTTKKITKIVISTNNLDVCNKLTVNTSEAFAQAGDVAVWNAAEGGVNEVLITNTNTSQFKIKSIQVFYA